MEEWDKELKELPELKKKLFINRTQDYRENIDLIE